jgi:hypothetical protein
VPVHHPLQYVLPTDAPHLADQGTRLRTVMTPVLWTQHRPDCFDTYSAGVVLMQLRWGWGMVLMQLRWRQGGGGGRWGGWNGRGGFFLL